MLIASAVSATALVGVTMFWQGSAHAERTGGPLSPRVATAIPTLAALSSSADVRMELNRLRSEKRLPELVFDDWMLGPTAQHWAETMAAKGHVFHDPELVGDYQDGWKTLSESVAAGGSADAALQTVLNNHRQAAQLFDVATTTAGVGLQREGDVTYLVVRFVAS